MSTHILVVDDDHLQEGPLVDQLEEAFPGGRIEKIRTEHDFRERLRALRADVPDLVVMDVMLRWADPSPNSIAPPEEIIQEGFYRAGLRCAELMAQDSKLKAVPVILYTILEKDDLERHGGPLPANVTYMRKSADLDILLRKARELARCS